MTLQRDVLNGFGLVTSQMSALLMDHGFVSESMVEITDTGIVYVFQADCRQADKRAMPITELETKIKELME